MSSKIWLLRSELRQMIREEQTMGRRGPAVARGSASRGRLVPNVRPDPSAKQPYTKDELAHGEDVSPGIMGRLRSMFLGQQEEPDRAQVAQLRSQFERYREMHRHAEASHDAKRSHYAKERMKQAHAAWREAGGSR